MPTVCRKIAELERYLGAQLLIRSTRSLVVTESGQRYYESARRLLDTLTEIEAEAAGEYRNPFGQLTITAPTLFGKLHVLPILRHFMVDRENITARLLFTNFVVNLLDEHVDLGIRIGTPLDSLVARRVGEIRHCYCASPQYLASRGTPKSPEDLAQHDCITFSKVRNSIPWFFKSPGQTPFSIAVEPKISVNMADSAADAASAGGGVTWLYSYQAAPRLADGSLVCILAEFEPDPEPVSIVYPTGRLLTQRARYFLDFAAPKLHNRLKEVNSCLHPQAINNPLPLREGVDRGRGVGSAILKA